MRYRSLGSTGLRVSEIGFGTWGLGGAANGAMAYGPTSDAESLRALKAAFDQGINFFDTADLYGYGHSEQVLGQALGGVRDRVVIASKGGMLDGSGKQDFTPSYLRTALERSLKRLGTDYVDLYQLHSPPAELLVRDGSIVAELQKLKAEGKIRAYGLSARSPEEALLALRHLPIACLQVNFNLVDQRAVESGLFDECNAKGTGVIARTPLCFGFLTGHYSAATRFDPYDHRNRWSAEQKERWAGALGLFLDKSKSRRGQSPAQFALRFCLSFPAVATAIPGMLTVEHVADNAAASDLGPLPAQECEEIVAVYRNHSFFVGA